MIFRYGLDRVSRLRSPRITRVAAAVSNGHERSEVAVASGRGYVGDRGEAAHDSRSNPYAESGRTMKIVRSVSAKDRSAIVTHSLELDVVHRPGPGGIQIWTRRFIP